MRLLTTALFFLSAQTSSALFYYTARVPATSQDCSYEARQLADRIRSTGNDVKNAVGRCVQTVEFKEGERIYRLYSLEVGYEAKSQIVFSQLQIPRVTDFDEAPFATYESCVSEVPEQIRVFESSTGQRVLDATCIPRGFNSTYGYRLQINGVGESRANLYLFNNLVRTKLTPEWKTQIETAITQAGAVIVKATRDNYYYYAGSPVELHSQRLFSTLHESECVDQLPAAREILQKLKLPEINLACMSNLIRGADLNVLFAKNLNLANDNGSHSASYHSYSECQTEKSALMARQPQLLGGFCVAVPGVEVVYRIELVLNN